MSYLRTVLFFFVIVCNCVYAQDNLRYKRITHDNGVPVVDVVSIKPSEWHELPDISEHPGISDLLTIDVKDSLLTEINERSAAYPKDTLLSPDVFYIFKPFFMWLRYVDPHYRVSPTFGLSAQDYKKERQYRKDLNKKTRYLPFNLINLNDTLLICNSLDQLFKKGDIVQSINGVESKVLLDYSYSDRLITPTSLLSNYFQLGLTNHYNVVVNRKGERIEIETSGWKSFDDIRVKLSQMIATEKNAKEYDGIGYIPIPEFFSDNSRLIRLIRQNISSFKDHGVRKVILDLRNNPGGYGDRFDELLSVFIDRESIPYLRGVRVKLTAPNVQEYSRPLSDVGQTYVLSGEELISEVPLIPRMYVPEMEYYILMNEATGSIAASFCNIMQYNKAAELLGEPLLHNALKYGEGIKYPDRYPNSSIPALLREASVSSTEFDEFSFAENDILQPDYQINVYAENFCDGEDPILKAAVEYVRGQ